MIAATCEFALFYIWPCGVDSSFSCQLSLTKASAPVLPWVLQCFLLLCVCCWRGVCCFTALMMLIHALFCTQSVRWLLLGFGWMQYRASYNRSGPCNVRVLTGKRPAFSFDESQESVCRSKGKSNYSASQQSMSCRTKKSTYFSLYAERRVLGENDNFKFAKPRRLAWRRNIMQTTIPHHQEASWKRSGNLSM